MGVKTANNAVSILSGSITAGATSFVVSSSAGFPIITTAGDDFMFVSIDNEVVKVISTLNTTFTCEPVKGDHENGESVVLRSVAEVIQSVQSEARDNITGGTGILVTTTGNGPTESYVAIDATYVATKTELNAHAGDSNNPHGVTKSHVGLGSVVNAILSSSYTSTATNQYASSRAVYDGLRYHDTQHDDRYLRLTGGTLSGNLTLGQYSSINSYDNQSLVKYSSTGLDLEIGNYTINDTYIDAENSLHFLIAGGYYGFVLEKYNATSEVLRPKYTNRHYLGELSYEWQGGFANYWYASNFYSSFKKENLNETQVIDASWIYNLTTGSFSLDYNNLKSCLPAEDMNIIIEHDSHNDIFGVDLTKFIPPIIKLIQDQKTTIDLLVQRIEALENA